MKNLKLNFLAAAALVLTLSASLVNAAIKPASLKPNAVYHISAIATGDIYTVTTAGRCLAGTVACSFTTTLSPDQPGGKFSKAFLVANGVTITNGTFTNP